MTSISCHKVFTLITNKNLIVYKQKYYLPTTDGSHGISTGQDPYAEHDPFGDQDPFADHDPFPMELDQEEDHEVYDLGEDLVDDGLGEPLDDVFDDNSDIGDPGDPGSESEIEEFEDVDDYLTILQYLSKEWLKVELTHRVSQVASQQFWELGKAWFARLFAAKKIQKIVKNVPTFVHLRRQFNKNYVPPVKMDFGYIDKDTGELKVVEDSAITPKTEFPSTRYQKMWEIGHVKVTLLELGVRHLRYSSTSPCCKQMSKTKKNDCECPRMSSRSPIFIPIDKFLFYSYLTITNNPKKEAPKSKLAS